MNASLVSYMKGSLLGVWVIPPVDAAASSREDSEEDLAGRGSRGGALNGEENTEFSFRSAS